jgi:hypothetical protein
VDRSGVGRLERMKRGSGIKDRDDRSSGIDQVYLEENNDKSRVRV